MADEKKKRFPLKQVSVRLKLEREKALFSLEPVNTPEKAVELVSGLMAKLDRENFVAINLDAKLHPLNFSVVTIGTVNQTMVDAATLFRSLLISGGSALIGLHNHPSGDPTPSLADYRLTKRVLEQAQILGVGMYDHIIVGAGEGKHFSFKEQLGYRFTPQGLDEVIRGLEETYGAGRSGMAAEFISSDVHRPIFFPIMPADIPTTDTKGFSERFLSGRSSVRERISQFRTGMQVKEQNATNEKGIRDISSQKISPEESDKEKLNQEDGPNQAKEHDHEQENKQEQAALSATEDTYLLYQLKDIEAARDFAYEPLEYLKSHNMTVDKRNYELVYSGNLESGKSREALLEGLFKTFNIDCPEDFTGASMSVSDVVVLRQQGVNHSFYVDRIGFAELPEFLGQDKNIKKEELNRVASRFSVRTAIAHSAEQRSRISENKAMPKVKRRNQMDR